MHKNNIVFVKISYFSYSYYIQLFYFKLKITYFNIVNFFVPTVIDYNTLSLTFEKYNVRPQHLNPFEARFTPSILHSQAFKNQYQTPTLIL